MIYDDINKKIDISKIGGKAYNLKHLSSLSFNVPKWFCLTTEFFGHFLGEDKKEYEKLLNNYNEENRIKIIRLIERKQFSEELKKIVNNKLSNYTILAVRSSATDEDGNNHSFAGMLESFLNIKKENVFEYIKKCYVSCFSKRVMEYRKNNNMINNKIAMSVIIMEMVEPDYAGVVFTSNPKTNNPDEVFISVVKGLGEALVSGEKNSNDYTLNIFNEITYKNTQEFELNTELLELIAATSKNIEKSYKTRKGLDIEFAIKGKELYILQSRPIATVSYVNKNLPRTILDNSNIIESYSGVTTPLTYTFAKEVYSKIYHQTLRNFYISEDAIASIEDDLNNMLYFYENKIYYKLNSWYKMTSLYPGYEKNKKYMENMMGVKTPLEESKTQAKTRLLKIYSGFIYKMLRMKKDSKAFLEKFNKVTEKYRNNKFENIANKELVKIYETLESEILEDFTTPIANDMGAMVLYGMLTDKIKKKNIPNGDGLISKILSKQGNVESVKQTTELIDIVNEIKNNEKLLEEFRKDDVNSLIKKLDENNEEIFVRLNEYIKVFGARSMEELKLETITLFEDPTFLFKTIKKYLEIDLNLESKEDVKDDNILNYFHFIDKLYVRILIKATKYFIRNRESLRLRRTYIYDVIRSIFLRIGHNFYNEDIIDNCRDIFYLEKNEIFAIVHGESMKDIKQTIELRKKEYLENKDKTTYERMYFYGDVTPENMLPIYSEQEKDDNSNVLTGVAGGGQVKIGIVKYISNPNESFEKGYILMAKRTDPGWTVLFPMAEAIIIERGSILSHSAVVAREMGKTLVVGIRGLTDKIHDGDRIRVDGINGTVEFLGDEDE